MKRKISFFNYSNSKIIVLLLLIFISFISIPALALEVISLPIEKTEQESYKIEAKIPLLRNLKKEEIKDKYNIIFRDNVLSFIEYTLDIAEENNQYFSDTNLPQKEVIGIIDFDLKNTEKILSIKFNYYQYTGGAHGNSYASNYNIDLNTGENLKLIDFLKRQDLSFQKVEDFIKSEIEKNSERYFQAEYSFQNLAENQHYYINNGELVVYFLPYSIAPYSSGMPEFKIKY